MTKCHYCGREDVTAGPMHTVLLSRSFPERRRDFCKWECANAHMYMNKLDLDVHHIEVRFMDKYGEQPVKIMGR